LVQMLMKRISFLLLQKKRKNNILNSQ